MKNVTIAVEKNELVIRVDLTKDLGLSSTGKTRIISTTAVNADVPGHAGVMLGLNVFKRVRATRPRPEGGFSQAGGKLRVRRPRTLPSARLFSITFLSEEKAATGIAPLVYNPSRIATSSNLAETSGFSQPWNTETTYRRNH